MIIESIINYLELSLKAAMPEVLFQGLCTLLETTDGGEKTKTIGKYNSLGEFDPINYDGAKAQLYLRYDGAISTEELDEEEYSCDVTEEMTIPFKVVFIANKSYREDDTAYTSHNLAMALKKALTATNPAGVLSATKLDYFTSRVRDTDVDFQSIAEDEGFKADYNSTLISMRLEVIIRGRQGCFEDCDTAGAICLPGTAKNSDNTYSVSVPSGETVVIPDITIFKEDGSELRDEPAAIDITIQNANVRNSNSTYAVEVAAEGSLILPDIQIVNSLAAVVGTSPSVINVTAPDAVLYGTDGVTVIASIPSGDDYNYDSITAAQHTANLTTIKRQRLPYGKLPRTGQTTSYVNGDDGFYEKGAGADWLTLLENNVFGNTNRFTDILGGQNYSGNNNILLDHEWSLMWYLVNLPGTIGQTFAQCIALAEAFSHGGHTDWRAPNYFEMLSTVRCELGQIVNAPWSFDINGTNYVTSDTIESSNPTNGRFFSVFITNASLFTLATPLKSNTAAMRMRVCRDFSREDFD